MKVEEISRDFHVWPRRSFLLWPSVGYIFDIDGRYLSSHASRLFAAPISSTTEVRKSLGGLREVLPSYVGLVLRSEMAFWRLLVAALILMTRPFRLSVSTP